jgi:hypothetical protein
MTLSVVSDAIVAVMLVMSAPTAVANAAPGSSCDERWEACNSPRWCETTGQYLPPFSGYCPTGPVNYPPPRLGR